MSLPFPAKRTIRGWSSCRTGTSRGTGIGVARWGVMTTLTVMRVEWGASVDSEVCEMADAVLVIVFFLLVLVR